MKMRKTVELTWPLRAPYGQLNSTVTVFVGAYKKELRINVALL